MRGAAAVASQALKGLASILARPGVGLRPVLVNGAAGVIVTVGTRPVAVMGFTVACGRIVEVDAIADPEHAPRIAAAALVDL